MIPMSEGRLAEHRLRVARAERVGLHLAEIKLQKRRHDRGLAVRTLRRQLGVALVAVGARFQGGEHAARPVAAVPGQGVGR